jgi:Cu/Ag efflux protein CusF
MKKLIFMTLIGLLTICSHVTAQTTKETTGTANVSPSSPTSPVSQVETSEAEVRKVDLGAGKVTLRHGEIKNLGMPPMTMVFQVKDRAFLNGLKAGDSVKFTADKIKGAYTVLSIEVVQ